MSGLAACRVNGQAAAAQQPGRRRPTCRSGGSSGQQRGPAPPAAGRRKAADDAGLQDAFDDAFPPAGELPPELAAKRGEVAAMLPDPANPPENLLDDSGVYGLGGFGLESGDWGWQQGAGAWGADDYAADLGAGAGAGGAQLMGGPLRSADFSADLLSEVGEGNSFRREQRERYAAAGGGVHNMTSLAHATEEELLASAELQALEADVVEQAMDEAITLHHAFVEDAVNRYAVAVRLGELIEQVEADDWLLEGGELLGGGASRGATGVPSWCRAAFALREQWDQLQEDSAAADEETSAREVAHFESLVDEMVDNAYMLMGSRAPQRRTQQLADGGDAGAGLGAAADDLSLDDLLLLPGTEAAGPAAGGDAELGGGGEGDEAEANRYAADLLQQAASGEPGFDYLSLPLEALSGDAFAEQLLDAEEDGEEEEGGDGLAAAALGADEEDGEDGEDGEEEGGGGAAAQRRSGSARLPSHFRERKASVYEKHRASAMRAGLPPIAATNDPLLNTLHVDDI